MLTPPERVDLPEQPYLFIPFTLAMGSIATAADKGFPELFGWLAARRIAPSGAPFFNYRRFAEGTLDVEVGVPVAGPVAGEGRVLSGVLPAGRYGRAVWTGSYAGLREANAALDGWARDSGIGWDMTEGPDGIRFACRLEIYRTDPAAEPDPAKWVTEIVIKMAEG